MSVTQNKSGWRDIIIVLFLTISIFLPRVFDLGAFMTADEKIWIANTQGFTRNLALLKLDKLLQQPHPGITTQWLGSLAIYEDSLAAKKLPLVLGQSLIIVLIGYIFYRLWGKHPAFLLTLLLALNPFLVAHTRVYAMDSLLAQFLLLSLGCLLLWHKTDTTRYLIFAGVSAALAALSKLPGLLIIPFSLVLIMLWSRNRQLSYSLLITGYWLLSFLLTALIAFPSLAFNFQEVIHLINEFLLTGDAQDTHGPTTNFYYLKTLFFFSTPLHLLVVIILPFLWKKTEHRETITIFLLFALLFTAQMTLGAKKGDRYILPSFLMLDALVVLAAFSLASSFSKNRRLLLTTYGLLFALLTWQTFDLAHLHPHALAYVNPVTKPLYGNRRLGWGEGLDLAADYLNSEPNANTLRVATVYPTEFAYNFNGEVLPLNHFSGANADYVLIYRSLFERGPAAWETDIIDQFSEQAPENLIKLGGLDYVWIYRVN